MSTPVVSGLELQGTEFATGTLSPAQITANQNDYAPTGHAVARFFRLSTDASRTLTGLAGGAAGRMITICNVGAQDIVLSHSDALSTFGNRFLCPNSGSITLKQNDMLFGWYDPSSNQWRLSNPLVVGGVPAAPGSNTQVPYNNGGALAGATDVLYTEGQLQVPTLKITATEVQTGILSPAAIAANQNNWAPTGHATARIMRISATGSRNITGLQGGTDGRIVTLINVGSSDIGLLNEATASTAANRFSMVESPEVAGGHGFWLRPNSTVDLYYDNTAQRWRLLAYIQPPLWHGRIYGAMGDCDPNRLWEHAVLTGSVAATPTNIGTTVARFCAFRPPATIVVNKIRYFGVGATTNVYRTAIYDSSGNRLTAELPFTTSAQAWGAAGSALNLTLTAGALYYIAVAVNATGTTAGVLCTGATQSATAGQINVVHSTWPGNLTPTGGFRMNVGFAQNAVTAGALTASLFPNSQSTVWTGGFPAFWLDNSDA